MRYLPDAGRLLATLLPIVRTGKHFDGKNLHGVQSRTGYFS